MFRQVTIFEREDGNHQAIEGWDIAEVEGKALVKPVQRIVPACVWIAITEGNKEKLEGILKKLI